MIKNEVRNRNLNRATATAASRESSEEASTAAPVTYRLFLKNVQKEMPMALPLKTLSKLDSVGWAGSTCGVREKISVLGLNAVEIIHTIGARVITATSTPAPLRAAARILAEVLLCITARGASPEARSEPGCVVTAKLLA
jgi:hypothetical protein